MLLPLPLRRATEARLMIVFVCPSCDFVCVPVKQSIGILLYPITVTYRKVSVTEVVADLWVSLSQHRSLLYSEFLTVALKTKKDDLMKI